MRAVVDTNVLVSAAIKPLGRLGSILDLFRSGFYTLVTSPELLDELVDVLSRKRFSRYGIDLSAVVRLRTLLEQDGEVAIPIEQLSICRDPKDNRVLEAAVAGRVDVIVSGDSDLLILDPFQGIRILSPSDFLRRLHRLTQD